MKNISIKTKLILLMIISIMVVSISILINSSITVSNNTKNFIDEFEKQSYSNKADELKQFVEIASKTITIFYEKSQKDPQNLQQYKSDALDTIRNLRYGKEGYFWINNTDAIMLMHPIREELKGTNIAKNQDVDGVYTFKEMMKVTSLHKEGGLFEYKTYKTDAKDVYKKFSYVIKFEPWDWIIGTGAYVDNIEASINVMKEETNKQLYDSILVNIMTILVIILFLTLMMLYTAKKIIFNPLNDFQNGLLDFFKYLNNEQKTISPLVNNTNDEIGQMSKVVNQGIEKVQVTINQKNIDQWQKDGVTQLNQHLLKLKDIQSVANQSIDFICSYLDAGVGVLYLYEESDEKLVQYASFAHVIRDEVSYEFKLKEGIIGQVAFQKKPILLTNIKKDENLITTGTITQSASNTYTFPLIYADKLYGVLEIGSFNEFKNKDLEFIDLSNKIICQALINAIQDTKVNELLHNTKKANQQLEENQLKLEEANASMEEQQQQLEEANASMEEQQQQLIISEQNLKLQNQQLEETKEDITKKADELERSGKYKSEFLANMSHELRTPLNSIILLSSLLQRNTKKTLSTDDIKKAKTVYESGNELLRLINDILDLSKVESGKMKIIIDSFKSKDLLEGIKDVFEYTAIEKGLQFHIVDEYNGTISSDKDRILQIVRNLVSNAFKFTSEGSITVKITPSETKDFQISVIDTGIGIPKEKQKVIFQAFMQADGSTNRKYGGTGLGLSITRELGKLLHGSVSVTSIENSGSTFSVDLSNLSSKDYEEDKTYNHNEETIISLPQQTLPPVTIEHCIDDREKLTSKDEAYLIIDDDKNFAEIVYEEIKKEDNFVLIALNARDGLQLVKTHRVKGILLDLTLPDMDGMDVLKELKSNPQTKNIPVHVISSKDKDNKILELGAIGYLQKPVYDGDINNIISSIDTLSNHQIKDLLIVENNKVHRESLSNLLETDVVITGTNSASQAIKSIKENNYDTVIVDFELKNEGIFEVCEFIKNSYPNLPIIIYTETNLNEEEKRKVQAYSNSIIVKTENSNERILNEINLFLNKKNPEEENNEIFELLNLEGTSILIVDDDIKNIFVLDAALKEFNATTFTAFNGKEALDFLESNPNPDLILMDIMMPVMDGYEAMQKIKENEKLKHIPIIAVTAKAMKEDREECIRLGADDYMSKPLDITILGNIIKQWIKKKSK